MGYESSAVARRRLTLVAREQPAVLAALDSAAPPWDPTGAVDSLLRDALDAPGAAAEFLDTFATHVRALRVVWEAHARGSTTLPADVADAVCIALSRTPPMLGASTDAALGSGTLWLDVARPVHRAWPRADGLPPA